MTSTKAHRTLLVMKLLLIILTLFFASAGFAQDSQEKPKKPLFEFGAYTGTLLLAEIPEVIDNVPPILLRLGWNSGLGSYEVSLMHARGNDMRWRSGMIDYRFDLDDLNMPFHVLLGLQADMYQVYDGEREYYGGGWHYGGGAHFEIIPHLTFRADFVNRFGPGRSLLVVVGLAVGIGEKDDK